MPEREAVDLTDDELLAVMKSLPWEKRLSQTFISGRFAAVAAVVMAAAVGAACAAMYDPHGLPVFIVIACVLAALFSWMMLTVITLIGLYLVVETIAGRRSRFARRELDRRYGRAWPARYIEEARCEIAEPGGPDWMAVLTGNIQPHGGDVLLRLRIVATGPATLELRGKRDAHLLRGEPEADLPELHSDHIVLDEAERAAALDLLQAQIMGDITFASTVRDGFPCHLVVVSRDPARLCTLSCNLAGLPPQTDDHPAIQLAGWMLAFRARVPSARVLMGSCDQRNGTVFIGEV